MESELLLRHYLKRLRLPVTAREYPRLAREAIERNLSHEDFLLGVLEQEVLHRDETSEKTRIKRARFPLLKTLDSFDFSAVASVSKQKVLQLARGEFLERAENVALIGSSGTGKTHLAIALGISLCRLGKKVRFSTVSGLVNALMEARADHTLSRIEKALYQFDLVILDELGYLSLSREAAELLFTFCAAQYERHSLCITSNLEFSAWSEILGGDARMAAALIDRLTHRCHVLVMNGESFRFKQSHARRKKLEADGPSPAGGPLGKGLNSTDNRNVTKPEEDGDG